MTREQEELQEIRRYLWEDIPEGYDLAIKEECDSFAEELYNDGWRRQVEAEWVPVEKLVPEWGANIIHHYECSNCKILEYTNDGKYCENCGAKMRKR